MALTYGLAAQEDQNSSHFDNPGYFAINAVRVHFTFTDLEKVKKDFPKLFENNRKNIFQKNKSENPSKNIFLNL